MQSVRQAEAGGWPATTAAFIALLAAAAITFLLTGCSNDFDRPRVAGWSMIDPAQRHPIIVSQEPQTMEVRVSPGAVGLSPRQRADVLDFAHRARASDAGNSRLVIAAPSGSANEVAAMHAVGEIRHLLGENGFPDSSIAVEAFSEPLARNPPVRVSYLRYIAEAPQCGSWPTNLAREYDNLPYANFGCATQHNFAVQVANPADLVGPRTETDRPGERRDVVWDKYIQGESTTSKKTEDERSTTKTN